MKKKCFFDFLSQNLNRLTLNEQITAIDNIQYLWIKEYKELVLKDTFLCPTCKKYSKKEEVEKVNVKEIRDEPDSGGYMKVSVMSHKHICPKCHATSEYDFTILDFLE